MSLSRFSTEAARCLAAVHAVLVTQLPKLTLARLRVKVRRGKEKPLLQRGFWWMLRDRLDPLLLRFAAAKGIGASGWLRLARLCGVFGTARYDYGLWDLVARICADGHTTLHALAEAAEEEELGRSFDRQVLAAADVLDALPDEALMPFFDVRPKLLEQAFAKLGRYDFEGRRERDGARAWLARLPPPPDLRPRLLTAALDSARGLALWARHCLRREPDLVGTLLPQLSAGKAQTRIRAAEWLASIGDESARAPLLAALESERSKPARAALLDALDALGADLSPWVGQEPLRALAERKPKLPRSLTWLAIDSLPVLRWKRGKNLDPAVQRALVLTAHKLKDPEPDAFLRHSVARLTKASRTAFGSALFERWLGFDLRRRTPEEIDAYVPAQARTYMRNYGMDRTQAEKWARGDAERTLPNSGTPHKGLLALVAACQTPGVSERVRAYLDDWYGWRAAQCKALLSMLGHVDAIAAVQLLVGVSQRFRTAGIKKQATKVLEELAERRGWTVEELGDRSVPTAGLDAAARLVLDYGERSFTARVDAHGRWRLSDEEGKPLKSLPAARKAEAEDIVKEARRALKKAKREVKEVFKVQPLRLYQAMCTERSWPLAEWRSFLLEHPLLGPLCRRLVWLELSDGQSFRPTEDGGLIDAAHEEVSLPPRARVGLAHASLLPADLGEAWLEHLGDYSLTPLFPQFGRPVRPLEEGERRAAAIERFKGYVLGGFALRNVAKRLGYSRGEIGDGGWFYDYRKSLPDTEVLFTFSGSRLPLEDEPVRLDAVVFERKGRRLSLTRVPDILLLEVLADGEALIAGAERE